MFEKIKKALRRSGTTFDDQITDCIEYVRRDLFDLGVAEFDEENPRIVHLAELYAKSVFDFDGKGAWFLQQYERLRNQITLQEDYRNV